MSEGTPVPMQWGFVEGSESEGDKTIKLRSTLKSWDDNLKKAQSLYYHYTSLEIAPLIAQSGFKVSDIGMAGRGVYFATQSLVDEGFRCKWPLEAWKIEMLKRNYADAWQVSGIALR